jgi:diaminohydroxyphosphoribosylaminopyrimidine deaminase/5-amino-6-(5-phosphoribosylamino)uracil reductase
VCPGDGPALGLSDDEAVARAVELARPYVGRTGPNPSVGAVVVKNGRIIGSGWHRGAGYPHAEKVAIDEAGADAGGADLYVTLEPCNFAGRTPPCTKAIISAGIKRIVAGTLDPNPKVAGKGVKELRDAGIEVTVGALQDECRRLVEGYAKYITTGLPWITVKYAMTLDGKIATKTGDSFWITGEAARVHAHELRWEHSAILVGAGTVKCDDPQLTVRLEGKDFSAGPIRIVVSSNCDLPPNAKVFSTPPATWVVTTEKAAEDKRDALRNAGAEVVDVARKDERIDLRGMLRALGERGVTSVLVEGGSEISGGFLDAGLVDKIIAYIAPKVVGGAGAKTPIEGEGAVKITNAVELREVSAERLGVDYCIKGYITDVDRLFPE